METQQFYSCVANRAGCKPECLVENREPLKIKATEYLENWEG